MQTMTRLLAFLILTTVGATTGCHADRDASDRNSTITDTSTTHEREVALAREAAERAMREERSRLLVHPDAFLETSDISYYDKGIINDYRQLVGVTVLNTSRLAIRRVQGQVTWFDAKGREIGSVPFSLNESIPAGGTTRFSEQAGNLSNGTIQGSGVRVKIHFTTVDVIEPT